MGCRKFQEWAAVLYRNRNSPPGPRPDPAGLWKPLRHPCSAKEGRAARWCPSAANLRVVAPVVDRRPGLHYNVCVGFSCAACGASQDRERGGQVVPRIRVASLQRPAPPGPGPFAAPLRLSVVPATMLHGSVHTSCLSPHPTPGRPSTLQTGAVRRAGGPEIHTPARPTRPFPTVQGGQI